MRRAAEGFTLLELLVAMTLLALVLGVLFGTLRLSGRSWDAADAAVARATEMRTVHELLRRQWEGLRALRWKGDARQHVAFVGDARAMRYAAPLAAPGSAGGMQLLELALDGGAEGRLVLARMEPSREMTEMPDFSGAERSALAEGVTDIRLSYFGRDADNDTPGWRAEWPAGTRLPELIRLEVRGRAGEAWPDLLVAPRLAAAGNAGRLQ